MSGQMFTDEVLTMLSLCCCLVSRCVFRVINCLKTSHYPLLDFLSILPDRNLKVSFLACVSDGLQVIFCGLQCDAPPLVLYSSGGSQSCWKTPAVSRL